MPIKDRTRRRLVRLGTIRLGIQVPNKNNNGTHPIQTDYFVLKDAPELIDVYGEKPRELDVLLPFPDIDRNFDAWYQVWAGGVLVCQGDGEYVQYATPHKVTEDKRGTHVYNAPGDTLVSNGVAQIAFDWNGIHFETGELVECPGARQDLYPHCAACRLNGLLKVMMADPRLFRMGYYQISTGSKRNFDTIMGTLEMMPADRLNGIPFVLRLVEEQITYQENGKRKKGKKWFLQLEPDPTLTRKLYKRVTERMLDEQPRPIALPEPAGPDWDSLVVDVPEPPPYAVDGVFDEPEPETDYPGGNGLPLPEEDNDPPLADFEPVSMPDTVKGEETLVKAALDVMGAYYKNPGDVMTALYQYGGNDWRDLPVVELWQALNNRIASALEAAHEEGDGE